MLGLVLGMLVVLGLALFVVGSVAIPAMREGRAMLTSEGEQVLVRRREHAHH